MTNINFIITKPSTGYDIVDANVMAPSTTISQFDIVSREGVDV